MTIYTPRSTVVTFNDRKSNPKKTRRPRCTGHLNVKKKNNKKIGAHLEYDHDQTTVKKNIVSFGGLRMEFIIAGERFESDE